MQAFCLVYSSMDCVMFERNPGRPNKVVERANRGQSEKHVTFRTERKEKYQIDFGVLTLKTNSFVKYTQVLLYCCSVRCKTLISCFGLSTFSCFHTMTFEVSQRIMPELQLHRIRM